jgi:hypothetical protein
MRRIKYMRGFVKIGGTIPVVFAGFSTAGTALGKPYKEAH